MKDFSLIYKAKIKFTDPNQRGSYEYIPIDENGYVRGWYVDGFIVGKVLESTFEYFVPDFWCPVDVSTLVKLEEEAE